MTTVLLKSKRPREETAQEDRKNPQDPSLGLYSQCLLQLVSV